jgi:hypothetical protein
MTDRTGIIEVSHLITDQQLKLPAYMASVELRLQGRLLDALTAALDDGREYTVSLAKVWFSSGTKLLPVKVGRHAVVSLAKPMDAQVGEYAATSFGINARSGRLYRRETLTAGGEQVELWRRIE